MKREERVKNIIVKIPVKVKREAGCVIYYNPKYNISGYGKTAKQADQMFKFCLDDILKFTKPARNIIQGK